MSCIMAAEFRVSASGNRKSNHPPLPHGAYRSLFIVRASKFNIPSLHPLSHPAFHHFRALAHAFLVPEQPIHDEVLVRSAWLDDKLDTWVRFLELLLRHKVDAVDEQFGAAAPDENVFDDFVEALKPVHIGEVGLIVMVCGGRAYREFSMFFWKGKRCMSPTTHPRTTRTTCWRPRA